MNPPQLVNTCPNLYQEAQHFTQLLEVWYLPCGHLRRDLSSLRSLTTGLFVFEIFIAVGLKVDDAVSSRSRISEMLKRPAGEWSGQSATLCKSNTNRDWLSRTDAKQ